MIRKSSGFTLIEVMIAITILATLTVFTAQSIQSALQTSRKYREQIDEASELRDVLRIMENDINLAFHYRDIHKEISDELKKSSPEEGQNAPPPGGQERPNLTEFQGEKDALHFTTLANVRTLMDAKESDQAEVGYYLKSCKAGPNSQGSSNCLWRRLSHVIDDKVNEDGRAIVLLKNVQSFKLRYIGQKTEEEEEPQWLDRWMSGVSGDARTKDKFPSAVEIEIVVNRKVGQKTVPQSMSSIAAIRFPNNKVEKPKTENTDNKENQSAPPPTQ